MQKSFCYSIYDSHPSLLHGMLSAGFSIVRSDITLYSVLRSRTEEIYRADKYHWLFATGQWSQRWNSSYRIRLSW